MKKNITKRLSIILFLTILFSLIFNFFIQYHTALNNELTNTRQVFNEMRNIFEANDNEDAQLAEATKKIALVRAKAVAYIIHHNTSVRWDQEELKKIAGLLLVDEIHIFTPEGTIYAGTDPQYFGMNFDSGEQMRFFLPMLKDRTLSLCQDITPNTAEGKPMQYAAVWCSEGKSIVQIGMTPERVMKSRNSKGLSYIFSMVTIEPGTDLYAIDPDSLEILASTRKNTEGCSALDFGFQESALRTPDRIFFEQINDTDSLCIYGRTDSMILASVRKSSFLYTALIRSSLLVALYVIIVSSIALFFIIRYLNHDLIHGIYDMNDKLEEIEKGNLVIKVPPQQTPEMTELSDHINDMVTSLINQQTKLSLILETVKLPIGTYEYNMRTKQLIITTRTLEIMGFGEEHLHSDIAPALFREQMDRILSSPVSREKNLYLLPGSEQRFVHVEYFKNEDNILGIIMDVTDNFREKQLIEHERDVDLLTSLLSRRAFYRHMDELFENPTALKHAALIMIDSDNLKFVNDTYGHTSGDLYLQAISRVLEEFPAQHKLAARLSGDEFILFLYGYESRLELEDLIHILCKRRENNYLELKNENISVKFSAGCSFYPEDSTDYSQLMKQADAKMYEDKKARKGII